MPDSISQQFRAARIDSALQERTISSRVIFSRGRWFGFFLESGYAVAQSAAGEVEMTGPALHWGPLEDDTRLRIAAGSVGHYLIMTDRLLDEAIGVVAEAAELRLFAQRAMMVSFDRGEATADDLEVLFGRIAAEAGRPRFGSEIAVSAYARLLLVILWRGLEREGLGQLGALGSAPREINRFRSLVESHFRARWKAQDYAQALGMSYDRLHDLCLRAVGRPPAQLIRERSLHEAQILLQRTALSSEQIAAMLGFTSASQFNHFFKAMARETPGAFRKRALSHSAEAEAGVVAFSDWP